MTTNDENKNENNADFNVLVLSDTHGNTVPIHQLLKSYNGTISAVVHLGDHARDMLRFTNAEQQEYQKESQKTIEYHVTNGNTDPMVDILEERVIQLNGKQIFITHGHRYNVKTQLDSLVHRATKLKVAACLFGHTHIPTAFTQNNILFFNPGSITFPAQGTERGYGMLRISENITGKLLTYREPAWNL